MRQGNETFDKEYPQFQEKNMLYDGATGTNYGISNDELGDEFGCNAFAGYAGIDDNYYASAADFNVLPIKNRYFENMDRAAFNSLDIPDFEGPAATYICENTKVAKSTVNQGVLIEFILK